MAKAYRSSYKLEYGMGKCTDGSASCLFCVTFGSEQPEPGEENKERKRKRTDRQKFFTAPFVTAQFISHLKTMHAKKYAAFTELSHAARENFFKVEVKHTDTVKNYFEAENNTLEVFIDKPIVDILIGTLLLTDDGDDDDDGGTSFKDRSLAIFRKEYDGEDSDTKYRVVIKSVTQFRLTIRHLADALTFSQVAKTLIATKEVTSLGTLGYPNRGLISEYARCISAWNFNMIKNVLSRVWSFSIAFDNADHQSESYVDLRVRFQWGDDIHDIHVIPLFH